MKSIFRLLLICSCFTLSLKAQNAPIVPKFAVEGARWYYKNIGKNSDVVKHIYVERNGDSTVEAFNFSNKKYEDYDAARIIFHYLYEDSTIAGKDTLLIKTDTSFIGFYNEKNRVFFQLYSGLSGTGQYLYSVHPFAHGNMDYNARQRSFQYLTGTNCAKLNGTTLGYYELTDFPCWTYPLGNEILERVGSTYYMLRFDSCRKDLYGGPLIWYYDPELGLYEHGKTKLELCNKDTLIINSIKVNNIPVKEKTLKVYPVPFANVLHIESADTDAGSVHIYAMDGKCFFTGGLRFREKLPVNTENWPAGVYLVKQHTKHGIVTSKVIKL